MRNKRVLDETIVMFSEGRTKLARPTAYRTLYQWSKSGVKCPSSGKMVSLEWYHWGRALVTSVEAVERFMGKVAGESEEEER